MKTVVNKNPVILLQGLQFLASLVFPLPSLKMRLVLLLEPSVDNSQ